MSSLLLVLRTLRDKDNDYIRRPGVRYFVVEQFEEMSLFQPLAPHERHAPRTLR